MDVVARVKEIAEPVARAEGIDLLSVTFAKEGRSHVLRLTIERIQGPTAVGDCAKVSRAVGEALDVVNVIDHQYRLEVSSAGLTRPIRTLSDFRRNVGNTLKIDLVNGRSGSLVGTLDAADEGGLTLQFGDGTRRTVQLPDVVSAQREIRFYTPDDRNARTR